MESLDFYAPWRHALKEIRKYHNDGGWVSVDDKAKGLIKFGGSAAVGTSAEQSLMTLPTGRNAEDYVTSDLITHAVSSVDTDVGACYYEGHYTSGSQRLFGFDNFTLNGQTPVELPTPLVRATRAMNLSASNWTGNISFYRGGSVTNGVPDDPEQVHLIIPGSEGQSQKASTYISSVDWFLLLGVYASVDTKTAAGAKIRLRTRYDDLAFRTIFTRGINSNGPDLDLLFPTPIIIRPDSDIIMTAVGNAGTIEVSGGFYGVFAS